MRPEDSLHGRFWSGDSASLLCSPLVIKNTVLGVINMANKLDGKPFLFLVKHREAWAESEQYLFPGPIQYFGPAQVVDATTKTLQYERGGKK